MNRKPLSALVDHPDDCKRIIERFTEAIFVSIEAHQMCVDIKGRSKDGKLFTDCNMQIYFDGDIFIEYDNEEAKFENPFHLADFIRESLGYEPVKWLETKREKKH